MGCLGVLGVAITQEHPIKGTRRSHGPHSKKYLSQGQEPSGMFPSLSYCPEDSWRLPVYDHKPVISSLPPARGK